MPATESTMLDLATVAPDFTLPDPAGNPVRLDDVMTDDHRGLLVMFLCNHCPFVKHLHEGIAAFARDYANQGLAIVAISSNDAEKHPDDAPAKMAETAAAAGWSFPYLYDESQEVAKAYRAACTPDFFLFDADRRLVYRGQFDDARPSNDAAVTGHDLRRAADAVLAGEPAPTEQRPSIGCNIKWKPGNEPAYASA